MDLALENLLKLYGIHCPKNHTCYLVWVSHWKKFGFYCHECKEYSSSAMSCKGVILAEFESIH